MGLSDLITEFIEQLVNGEQGSAEFSRIGLAGKFNCVPSQINYVLSTRFSPERGYIVESRRGGGGYIRISRASVTAGDILMHTVNMVGRQMDYMTARALLKNLAQNGVVGQTQVRLIDAAVSERALHSVEPDRRAQVRAEIFKHCLLALTMRPDTSATDMI